MRITPALLFLAVVLLCPARSYADFLIYDNGVGGAAGIDSAQLSDNDVPFVQADDFIVSATKFLVEIKWTGAYIFLNSPPVDQFRINLFVDDGAGSPQNTAIATFNIGNAAARQISGATVFGFDVYEYTASIPQTRVFAGQRYWLSIANDTTGDIDDWYWGSDENVGNSVGRAGIGTWTATNNALDFQLQAVPEPNIVLVGLVGMVGLAMGRRRRAI